MSIAIQTPYPNHQAINTTVRISGIPSAKGQIAIGAFKDNVSFDKEQPDQSFILNKKSLITGTMTVMLNRAWHLWPEYAG